jgi:hypothetical protein
MRIAIVFTLGLAGFVAAVLFCAPLRSEIDTVLLGDKGAAGAQGGLRAVQPAPGAAGEAGVRAVAASKPEAVPRPTAAPRRAEEASQPASGQAAVPTTGGTAGSES